MKEINIMLGSATEEEIKELKDYLNKKVWSFSEK